MKFKIALSLFPFSHSLFPHPCPFAPHPPSPNLHPALHYTTPAPLLSILARALAHLMKDKTLEKRREMERASWSACGRDHCGGIVIPLNPQKLDLDIWGGSGGWGVEIFQGMEDEAVGARRRGRTNILPLTHTINSSVVNMMPHTPPGQMLLLRLKKAPVKTKSLPLICCFGLFNLHTTHKHARWLFMDLKTCSD